VLRGLVVGAMATWAPTVAGLDCANANRAQ
jgi:hypothetical protein